MRDAFGCEKICDEEFAAPHAPVRAEAQPVHRDADHFAFDSIIGHAARDVRVMMLDADFGLAVVAEREGVFGREIFRVQVVGDDFGLKMKEPLVLLDALFEGAQRFQVFQIADVVADEGVAPAREAEGAFKLRAARENLARELEGDADGGGRASRSSENLNQC